MLTTDQRELFLEALHPPEGCRFDCGIGTTFSLDLLILLVAPLSLALLDVSDTTRALDDPLLLLEGLRRYADRITIFCQAGRIAIPPPDNYLYSFLEQSIVQVQAPGGGVFHPKLWLLRYKPDAEGQPPLYRLLNLSRNLTFDRSWDLILRMEGYVATHRTRAYARNHPLGDFVQALPGLAPQPVDARIVQYVDLLQDEVRRVDFQVPRPFFEESLAFYPGGIPGRRGYRFTGDHTRAMIVSPFLGDSILRQLTRQGEGHVLISRADSIGALQPKTLRRFAKTYVLDEATAIEEETGAAADVGEAVVGARSEPSGLHAKLFILESGWDATWLVGSANATHAAFRDRNIEFLVKLEGRRSQIGIDKVLGEQDEGHALRSLLRSFRPEQSVVIDETERKAETLADRVREWLIALKMDLEVKQQERDQFSLLLRCDATVADAPAGQYTIACWPVTLHSERQIRFARNSGVGSLNFGNLSLLALTPFVAFEIVAKVKEHEHKLRFVLNLPISGIPEGRGNHLYSAIISDRGRFLRYLWLLLAGESDPHLWMNGAAQATGAPWGAASGEGEMPLLERLMRTLSRSPETIDRIEALVEGLRRTPSGQEVFPEGFEPFWDAVMRIRGEMR